MDTDRTLAPETARTKPAIRGTTADPRSGRADADSLRAPQRDPVEHAATRDGLWIRQHLLAATGPVAAGRGLEAPAHPPAHGIAATRPTGSGARRGRQFVAPRAARGKKPGPNPTDRRKAGSKHHVLTDAHGIPLVAILTAANRHDVTQLLTLVDAMPPLRGRPGRLALKPGLIQGDRAYDSQPHRDQRLARGIASPPSAARSTGAGSGARAGSSNTPSPGCIAFGAWRCGTNGDPVFTKRFSRWRAHSCAGTT